MQGPRLKLTSDQVYFLIGLCLGLAVHEPLTVVVGV